MNATAKVSRTVRPEDTAAALNADLPAAASTPFILAIAELAAHSVIETDLAEGEITVGTSADIRHLAPSPVGSTLDVRAELLERKGRRLSFSIEVHQGDDLVATVAHQRAIVRAADIATRLAGSG
jgi:fluoroacetyl-CoA thioesterase